MVIVTRQQDHVMDILNNGTGNQIINIEFDAISWPFLVHTIQDYYQELN